MGDESRFDTELGGESVEGPDGAVVEAIVVVGGEERGEGAVGGRVDEAEDGEGVVGHARGGV